MMSGGTTPLGRRPTRRGPDASPEQSRNDGTARLAHPLIGEYSHRLIGRRTLTGRL